MSCASYILPAKLSTLIEWHDDRISPGMQFVRYECGCVGFHGFARSLVIRPCDGDGPAIDPFWRTMGDKPYEPLADADLSDLLDDVAKLVQLGNRFKELKAILAAALD